MVADMFTQTSTTKTQQGGRWANYVVRAKTCFRATTVIDSTTHALHDALKELSQGGDAAAVEATEALREAEKALARARACLAAALEAKKLTPANREASYGLDVESTH
jgi:hypothetical protein